MKGKTTIGVGYLIAPPDVDYSKYIETCYKSKTISMITEESEVYHNVRINSTLFSQLKFPYPNDGELIGSILLFIRIPRSSIPTIISILDLSDSGPDLLPGQWKLTAHTNTANVSLIQGDTKNGSIDLIAHSVGDKSKINIRATSKNKDSEVTIESDNKVKIIGQSTVEIDSDDKIRLGRKNLEYAVLGNSLQKWLENFVSTMDESSVITTTGPAFFAPTTKERFLFLKDQLSEILSGKVILE